MFPSANYFRDIPCPFFSRVACPRPHCHFKHVQVSSQAIVSSNTSSSSSVNIPPDANETLNKLINQLSTAAAASSTATATTNLTPSVDFTSILHNTLLQSLSNALANALHPTTQPVASSEPVEKPTNATETVPQYRPTPIAELERRRREQQKPTKPTTKTAAREFDSSGYVQATFSPPSSPPAAPPVVPNQPASVEESKPKVTPQSIPSNTIPKQSQQTVSDDNHSWVTPPVRRKLSSSTDHHDFDERKSAAMKKVTPFEKPQPKPIATVKPNVIENPNRVIPPVNPLLKRIPKKTTTSTVIDVDLDRVPVTSTISVDTEGKPKNPTAIKRSSNGTNEIPQKKPKINPKPTIQKKPPTTNGTNNSTHEDDELALFDQAFTLSKPPTTATIARKTTSALPPPSSIQQFTSRYSLIRTTHNDSSSSVSTIRTRAETSTDGRRVAHQPKVPSNLNNTSFAPLLQPLVDPNSSVNKIPFKTRQEYLTFFLNELKKRATNTNELTPTTPVYSRAQSMEKEIFDKSTNKNSYLNLAAKYLRQLRTDEPNNNTTTEPISPKIAKAPRLVVSHSAMLTSGTTDNLSFGIKKKKDIDVKTLTDNELYTFLLSYKASERDLTENGYPAFSLDFPDKVLIKNKNPLYNPTTKAHSTDPFTRLCCRCSKAYKINKDGEYIKQEQCIYHWGRLISQRIAGQIEKAYSCCSSKLNTIGCAVSPCHVHDSDETQLLSGYVKTQPPRKPLGPNESYGMFALDCEMCYTINGLELVRVSVVNHKFESVYETLVKPHAEILDYNTRWSGITEEQLQNCNVTFEDVQKRLLKFFNSKSILIGHSLESDLKALKIVHETVVDTSLVFPHAKGRPYKRALKTLMSEYLAKIIQENAEGHDSIEDAISCMELMLWKVKQDLRSSSSTR